ncbi:hypothetical protein K2173_013912 [Erythroxylum novogranatense]|uniref:Uncharacterized protein n=1 Tax=Erythroxylum novogranatense TaxID=1862640 RepID=A0AAV8SCS1_9ROSI|nr:hypothetical protein K2173_013912 [Erythroxylum novogranatense]
MTKAAVDSGKAVVGNRPGYGAWTQVPKCGPRKPPQWITPTGKDKEGMCVGGSRFTVLAEQEGNVHEEASSEVPRKKVPEPVLHRGYKDELVKSRWDAIGFVIARKVHGREWKASLVTKARSQSYSQKTRKSFFSFQSPSDVDYEHRVIVVRDRQTDARSD